MAEAESHPATTSVYESDFDPTTYLGSSFPKLSDKHGIGVVENFISGGLKVLV